MKAQTITTPAGERLVMLPEAEFAALVEAVEDAADRTAVARFRRALAEGDEELVPAAIVAGGNTGPWRRCAGSRGSST